MNKHIFIINGSGGAGKDTFVNIISKYIPTVNYSSVEKIKEAAKLLGWDGSKTEKDRKFLSDIKVLSSEYNNYPYISIQSKIEDFLEDSINKFLFIHVREPSEIARIVKEYPVTTVLVKRSEIKHITSNMADKGVFDYDYDVIINNDEGLTELNEKAIEFCERFGDINE